MKPQNHRTTQQFMEPSKDRSTELRMTTIKNPNTVQRQKACLIAHKTERGEGRRVGHQPDQSTRPDCQTRQRHSSASRTTVVHRTRRNARSSSRGKWVRIGKKFRGQEVEASRVGGACNESLVELKRGRSAVEGCTKAR